MPVIHHRLTGGSLFNNRVLAEIAKSATVNLHIDSPDVNRSTWGPGIWLVDSLCLESGATHLRRCPDATGVLIVHYLKLVDPRHKNSPHAQAELAALQAYAAAITTSDFSRRSLVDAGFRGRVEAITPGLEGSYREPIPERNGSRRILTVGSLLPDKGLLEMLGVLETLLDLDWTWEVIGDDGLDPGFAAGLRDRVARSPVSHRVHRQSALPPQHVQAAYDRADVFVLPSRFETCSMVTMEAMARGLPVLAFHVGGLPDLLPEVSRQLLPDDGDLDRFRSTLRTILVDEDLRSALGEANRAAATKFFGWEDTGLAVRNLLREFVVCQ